MSFCEAFSVSISTSDGRICWKARAEVAGADCGGDVDETRALDLEQSLGRLQLQAILLHGAQMFAARDEGDFVSAQRQQAAEVAADRAGAHDCDMHDFPGCGAPCPCRWRRTMKIRVCHSPSGVMMAA